RWIAFSGRLLSPADTLVSARPTPAGMAQRRRSDGGNMESASRGARHDDLASFLWETGAALVEDVERYLASEQGAQVRKAIALGLIAGAPLLVKLPWVKDTPLGRL